MKVPYRAHSQQPPKGGSAQWSHMERPLLSHLSNCIKSILLSTAPHNDNKQQLPVFDPPSVVLSAFTSSCPFILHLTYSETATERLKDLVSNEARIKLHIHATPKTMLFPLSQDAVHHTNAHGIQAQLNRRLENWKRKWGGESPFKLMGKLKDSEDVGAGSDQGTKQF